MRYSLAMKKPVKRPRGRPRKGASIMEPRMIRFPPELIKAIEDLYVGRLDQPDFSSMVRELLAEAVQARRRKR